MEEKNLLYLVSPEQLKELARLLAEEISKEKKDSTSERYLSVSEVVSDFGVSRTTLWRWEKYGYLRPVRIGGKVKYRKSEITALMMEG